MGDTDKDPNRGADPASTAEPDPERTVVVPGRGQPQAPDPEVTDDYLVHEETTTVLPPTARPQQQEKTEDATVPAHTYRPAPTRPPPADQWASSPRTPPPAAARQNQAGAPQWPQSPTTPPPGGPTQHAPHWSPTAAGVPYQALGAHPAYAQQAPASKDFRTLRSRRPLLLGAGAVAALTVAVVLITGLWVPGYLTASTVDVKAAEAGVQQILTDPATGYGLPKVSDVSCNHGDNPTITPGGTFTCTTSIGGNQRQVTATFVGSDGTYSVGRPE